MSARLAVAAGITAVVYADAVLLSTTGIGSTGVIGAAAATIGVVATNAKLTKTQATKVAQMAHDGLARAVQPAHTPVDGDTLFAVATGTWDGNPHLLIIGELAAQATAMAIVRAARQAEGIEGYPAARDITGH